MNHCPATRKPFLLASLSILMILGSGVAGAQTDFEQIIYFGDSLSDSGNAFVLLGTVSVPPFEPIPSAPYARAGKHFSNGATWAEAFADALQLRRSAKASFRLPTIFTNYAVGGSRARFEGAINLTTQVGLFAQDFPVAPADALYAVVIGGNDLRDAIEAYVDDPTGQTSAQIIADAITAIGANISALAGMGASQFLVGNAPDLGLTPAVRAGGPDAQALATALSIAFNDALAATLDALEAGRGLTVARVDIFQAVTDMVADPGAFGLTEVIEPCLTFYVTGGAYCENPDGYLFWDAIHPTRAGHAIVADIALEALN